MFFIFQVTGILLGKKAANMENYEMKYRFEGRQKPTISMKFDEKLTTRSPDIGAFIKLNSDADLANCFRDHVSNFSAGK